ncbi:MAG TPA: MMPL family transporter [Candidatus Sulfotelmatobacter sp.]|nr:MMPL family transporter [Candidatus Sulfotelmatobacter sp.]
MLTAPLRILARAIAAHARPMAILGLAVSLGAALVVIQIPVTTDLLDVMPAKNPAVTDFTGFLRDFAALDGLVVVIESPQPSVEALAAAAQALGERLAASPMIASVDYNLVRSSSRLVAEHFPIYLDAPAIDRLARRLTPAGIREQLRRNRDSLLAPLPSLDAEASRWDPLNLRELLRSSLDRGAGRLDLSTGYYLDASHRLALLLVRPRGSARDIGFVRALEREIGRLGQEALATAGEPTLRLALAGGYARAAEALRVIWTDMLVSLAVSLVLVLAILSVGLRPPVLALAAFVATLLSSLAWTLLLAYGLYGSLNVVTSITAAMLIGVFVDYMIQVYRRFRECLAAGLEIGPALERTLLGTGKAIICGAITTSLGFFTVVVTGFRGLHELGVVAGFGILFCLLSTLVLFSALLCWLAQARPGLFPARAPRDVGGRWAAGLVGERPGAVALVGLGLVAAAVAAIPDLRFELSLESVGLRESAVRAVEERIAGLLGRRGEPLFVVARAGGARRLEDDFDRLERQGERWRQGRVASFLSPGALLPPPFRQRQAWSHLQAVGLVGRFRGPELAAELRREMDRQGLVPDPSLDDYALRIARALERPEVVGLEALAAAGDPRTAYYYNPRATAIAAQLMPPDEAGWTAVRLAALQDDVAHLGPDFRLVGPAVFLSEIRRSILTDAGLAAALTFGGNLVIAWLLFRRWREVAWVMLPVAAGSLLTLGAMVLLHLPFNFFNVAGIALIFGFGVDYGIYLMQVRQEAGTTAPEAVGIVGSSIVLCAVTTVASCGSLVTSHYRGLASIGAVLSLGAAGCLATTLLLVPALRHLGERRRPPA